MDTKVVRSKYFPAKRGRSKDTTIVRIVEGPVGLMYPFPELADGMLYIHYRGEEWFVLDQFIHVIWRFAGKPNGIDKNGIFRKMEAFCCPKECKDYIMVNFFPWIKTTFCYDRILLGQLTQREHYFAITDHTCQYKNQYVLYDHMNMFGIPKTYPSYREQVLLIDFQSTSELMNKIFDPIVIRLLAFIKSYNSLCNKRSKNARKALTKADKETVAASQGWKCNACDTLFRMDIKYEVDHVIPLHRGGSNSRYNLQALCTVCHKKKTEKERCYPLKPLYTERDIDEMIKQY
jgi:hypothetical protein